MQRSGIARKVRLTVPHFVALGHILHASDMIATVPERLARALAEPFGLVWRTHPAALPEIAINCSGTHAFTAIRPTSGCALWCSKASAPEGAETAIGRRLRPYRLPREAAPSDATGKPEADNAASTPRSPLPHPTDRSTHRDPTTRSTPASIHRREP